MAAELLLRLDVTPTLVKGAFIAVMPDGHVWGTEELTDRFIRVRIVDVDPEDLQYLLDFHLDVEGEILNKRRWSIANASADSIAAGGGYLATTRASLEAVLEDLANP